MFILESKGILWIILTPYILKTTSSTFSLKLSNRKKKEKNIMILYLHEIHNISLFPKYNFFIQLNFHFSIFSKQRAAFVSKNFKFSN